MDINTLPTAAQAGIANKNLVAQPASKASGNLPSNQEKNKDIDENTLEKTMAQASGRRGSLLDISV